MQVEGLVVGQPTGGGGSSFCFWQLQVVVQDADLQTDEGGGTAACLDEPTMVPSGERVLEFEFGSASGRYPAGLPAQVTLAHFGTMVGADARVELLTASIEQDSTLTFPDLEWPVGLPAI